MRISHSAKRIFMATVFIWLIILTLFPLPSQSENTEHMLTQAILQRFPDFQPQAIIDMGANTGTWTKAVRGQYPYAKILMIEATENKENRLRQMSNTMANVRQRIAVLSNESGKTVKFYQGGDTGNSMFLENTKHYERDVPVERLTTTLDDIIEQESDFIKFEDIGIIKMDIQGAELVALKGATKSLKHATFVQFESGTIEYNAGGACFYEMDEYLRSHGFYMYDFGKMVVDKGLFKTLGIGQFDVLYVKPSSPYLPSDLKETRLCGFDRKKDSSVSTNEKNLAMESTQEKAPDWAIFAMGFITCGILSLLGHLGSRSRSGAKLN